LFLFIVSNAFGSIIISDTINTMINDLNFKTIPLVTTGKSENIKTLQKKEQYQLQVVEICNHLTTQFDRIKIQNANQLITKIQCDLIQNRAIEINPDLEDRINQIREFLKERIQKFLNDQQTDTQSQKISHKNFKSENTQLETALRQKDELQVMNEDTHSNNDTENKGTKIDKFLFFKKLRYFNLTVELIVIAILIYFIIGKQ